MGRTLPVRIAPIGILLLTVFSLAHATGGKTFLHEKTYRLGSGEDRIAGEDRTGPYLLAHHPIFHGSEKVVLVSEEKVLEREVDYWIRYDRGEITFASALAEGEIVTVRYGWLPIPVPAERFLNKVRLTDGEAETPLLVPREKAPMAGPLDTGALRVGGSKSFSVLIGSDRELTLEQALRVSVAGNLTPDVRITAQLTDQNLPFQPDGRSERLEELDQVLVRVETPHLEATLGDYEVRYDQSGFGRYDRVLQGALGKVTTDRVEFELSGGISKGEFRSVEIRGVEGKQGPYSLLDLTSLGQVVVAGSEQVWLDGEKQTRGDDNDYVIDYNEGAITFNPTVPISSESRAAVDFQVTGDRYRRGFFTSRLQYRSADGRFRLGGTLLSEGDDENDPEAVVLTDADFDSLRVAGDSSPLGSTARPAQEGGDYDTLGALFVYAGRDSGEFFVSFREVPPGEGSYTDSLSEVWGRRIFVHVGAGKGDHEPTTPVPLPASHRLVTVRGEARPFDALRLEGEAAWSNLDRNVLSSIDDEDNGGSGTIAAVRLDESRLRLGERALGRIEFRAETRSVSENFEPLGRYRNPHREEHWMTPGLRRAIGPGRQEEDRVADGEAFASRGEETESSGRASWKGESRAGTVTIGGEGGLLRRSGFDSARRSWSAAVQRGDRYTAGLTEERIDSEEGDTLTGKTVRHVAEASFRTGPVRPSGRLTRGRREFRRDDRLAGGTRTDAERYGLSFGEGTPFEAEGAVTFEEVESIDSTTAAWTGWYESRTDEATLRWRGVATVNATYSHRKLDYGETFTEGNRRSDLGRLEILHGGFGGALRANWNYEVTTEERRPRRKILLRAPDGEEADYDSLGNYFPEEGTFNQVTVEGEPEPVLDLEAGATIRIEPGGRRGSDPNRFWKGIRSETFLRVVERSSTGDPARLLLLEPAAFQKNATTLRGNTLVRQEVRWSDPESDRSVRFRYQREDREENEFETIHRDDLIRTWLVRGKVPLGRRFAGELEWNRRLEEEDSNDSRAVDLTGDELTGTLLFHPTPRWRFRLPGSYRDERESVRREKVESIRLEPEVALNLAVKSRVDARLSWTRFLDERIDRAGSFLRNRKAGLRWRIRFAYEWNRVLSSSVEYDGENLAGERAEQRFRAEMRAYF